MYVWAMLKPFYSVITYWKSYEHFDLVVWPVRLCNLLVLTRGLMCPSFLVYISRSELSDFALKALLHFVVKSYNISHL